MFIVDMIEKLQALNLTKMYKIEICEIEISRYKKRIKRILVISGGVY